MPDNQLLIQKGYESHSHFGVGSGEEVCPIFILNHQPIGFDCQSIESEVPGQVSKPDLPVDHLADLPLQKWFCPVNVGDQSDGEEQPDENYPGDQKFVGD